MLISKRLNKIIVLPLLLHSEGKFINFSRIAQIQANYCVLQTKTKKIKIFEIEKLIQKQNHYYVTAFLKRTLRTFPCPTVLSNNCTAGQLNCQTTALSGNRIAGQLNGRTTELLYKCTVGQLHCRTTAIFDKRKTLVALHDWLFN